MRNSKSFDFTIIKTTYRHFPTPGKVTREPSLETGIHISDTAISNFPGK